MTFSPSSHQRHHDPMPSSSSSPAFDQPYPPTTPLPSFPPDHGQGGLPRIGQTRCYWSLLTSELQFIYLDPVLASHLEDQAPILLGKSLISFVHPEEQSSAKHDLAGVLENRTLHGSVTRVRFSRLSRVRRQLGYIGPGPPWSDADKISIDENYMVVDIVINYASEGLVLCFIHACTDLDPRNDNDENNKSDWSNWCGTPYIPQEELQCLFNRLLAYVPQQPPPSPQLSPQASVIHVFQILSNQPNRTCLISWPPDQHMPVAGQPTSRDFARLVENVHFGTDAPNSSKDAKTSCMRRYKATQVMEEWGGEVEGIYIPHGTVIFACHKFTPTRSAASTASNPSSASTTSTTTTTPTLSSPSTMHMSYPPPNSYSPQPQPSATTSNYYQSQSGTGTSGSAAYALPPLSATSNPSSATAAGQPTSPQPYSPQRWPSGPPSGYPPPHQQQGWGNSSPTHSMSPLPPSVSNLRSQGSGTGGWPPPPGPGGYHHHHDSHPSPVSASYDNRPISPYSPYVGSPAATSDGGFVGQGGAASDHEVNVLDAVPPPRRRVSPMSIRDQYGAGGNAAGASGNATTTGAGRAGGNRPVGVLKCSSCKATTSPEWRKGPSGKKELCNACGLRYARSRAKKEGHNVSSRKRKDRVISGGTTKHRDSATPPTASSAGGSPSASAYSGLGLPSSVGSVSSLSGRWDDSASASGGGGRGRWSGGQDDFAASAGSAASAGGGRWADDGGSDVYSPSHHPHHPTPPLHHPQHAPPPLSSTRTRHHAYGDVGASTPSPSPPAQSVSFVHYGVGAGAGGPSPLGNPPVSAGGAGSDSPLLLSGLTGPGAGGGIGGGLPSSYERDSRPHLPPMGVGLGRRDTGF